MSFFTKAMWAVKKVLGWKEKTLVGNPFAGINGIRGVSSTLFIDKPLFYTMYARNPDARSCVRKKAMYMGRNYFYLKSEEKDGKEIREQDGFEEFDRTRTLLSNPTLSQTMIEVVKHIDVSWELYILPTTDLDGEVNGMQILHPNSITKVIKGNEIIWFIQFDGQVSQYYHADIIEWAPKTQILKYYQLEKHVDNEFNGMGLFEGIAHDVMSDLKAQERNYAFFDNDWTPPSMVFIEEGLSADAQKILVSQLQERHRGTVNAHKPMIGIGVKDRKTLSVSPKDMEHTLQRKMTVDKVCSALDVPKSIIWYTEDVNRATSFTELKNFVEGTVNNYQLFFEYIVNDFIQTFWGDFKYEFVLEKQSIDDVEERKQDLEEVKNGTMSINEYRKKYGREPFPEEEANKPLVNKNVIFLEDVMLDATIDKTDT